MALFGARGRVRKKRNEGEKGCKRVQTRDMAWDGKGAPILRAQTEFLSRGSSISAANVTIMDRSAGKEKKEGEGEIGKAKKIHIERKAINKLAQS